MCLHIAQGCFEATGAELLSSGYKVFWPGNSKNIYYLALYRESWPISPLRYITFNSFFIYSQNLFIQLSVISLSPTRR